MGHFGNGRTATGALDATLLITKLPTLANMGNVAVVCKAGVTGGRAASSPPSLPPPPTDGNPVYGGVVVGISFLPRNFSGRPTDWLPSFTMAM